jgi:hypothetical protein
MIKTLRITAVLVAALAAVVVFVVLPAFLGVRSERQLEEFLDSPGAIEKFKQARGKKVTDTKSQTSPLVKQARAFALYLNPPVKPAPVKTQRSRRSQSPKRRPAAVASKFNLIGTSYYASNPSLSLALIDEPGKGLHWVRQSGKVGRLVIEKVNDGSVLIRDGQRTFEQDVVERPKKRNLIKSSSFKPNRTKSTSTHTKSNDIDITPDASVQVDSIDSRPTHIESSQPSPLDTDALDVKDLPQYNKKEMDMFDELIEKMEQVGDESGQSSEKYLQQSSKLLDEFVSQLESTRISQNEAQQLDRLGKQLQDNHKDPNKTKTGKIQRTKTSRRKPRRSRRQPEKE